MQNLSPVSRLVRNSVSKRPYILTGFNFFFSVPDGLNNPFGAHIQL